MAELKKDDMPKDSLALLNLKTGKLEKFSDLQKFQFPSESADWFSWHQKHTIPDDSTGKKMETLWLKSLTSEKVHQIPHVKSWYLNASGSHIIAVNNAPDSSEHGTWVSSTSELSRRYLAKGEGEYKNLLINKTGRYAAFVSDYEVSDSAETTPYTLYLHDLQKNNLRQKIEGASQHRKLHFSPNGKRLFFGYAAIIESEEPEIPEDEEVVVDIWHWQDPLIQPMQLKELKNEKKRSWLGYVDMGNNRIIRLGSETVPEVELLMKGDGDLALGESNMPYRMEISWDFPGYRDYYKVDVRTGKNSLLIKGIQSSATLSPKGNYAVWWSYSDSCWYSTSTKSGVHANLTRNLGTSFHNPLHDWAFNASPASSDVIFLDDETLLLSDRFDVWHFDLKRGSKGKRLTAGEGREKNTTYRVVNTAESGKYMSAKDPLLLFVLQRDTRASGFSSLNLKNNALQSLVFSDHRYNFMEKAKAGKTSLFTRQSFQEFPDLQIASDNWKDVRKLSNVNPQQSEYLWGTAEQMSYFSSDGQRIEGLLFKPENFDESRTYPLMVYFYEKNSDSFHRHRAPYPHRSVISVSFYTSRGYVVFIPDVHYTVGYPGESAMRCIMPGVEKLMATGYIDTENIGIQGHSWAGYQISYMVTRTNLFKAAAGGAPVSNMVSAYGGVRWRSGMSRMFQYERTQSRIGASLWEKPLHYLDNSPIFRVPDIHTPLLILHNDHDGAVPWYQGIELFLALRRLNKPAWLINYNNEPHWPVKYQNKVDWQTRLQQFFDHYLKGDPAPVWLRDGIPALQKGRTLGLETE